jgi:hypothetical protein
MFVLNLLYLFLKIDFMGIYKWEFNPYIDSFKKKGWLSLNILNWAIRNYSRCRKKEEEYIFCGGYRIYNINQWDFDIFFVWQRDFDIYTPLIKWPKIMV